MSVTVAEVVATVEQSDAVFLLWLLWWTTGLYFVWCALNLAWSVIKLLYYLLRRLVLRRFTTRLTKVYRTTQQ